MWLWSRPVTARPIAAPIPTQDLSLIPVTTLQEVLEIISLGLKVRATHETQINQVGDDHREPSRYERQDPLPEENLGNDFCFFEDTTVPNRHSD